MSKLSEVLDRQNWQRLQDYDMDTANALYADIEGGKEVDVIRREALAAIGETRMGSVNMIVGAARYLVRQREAGKA